MEKISPRFLSAVATLIASACTMGTPPGESQDAGTTTSRPDIPDVDPRGTTSHVPTANDDDDTDDDDADGEDDESEPEASDEGAEDDDSDDEETNPAVENKSAPAVDNEADDDEEVGDDPIPALEPEVTPAPMNPVDEEDLGVEEETPSPQEPQVTETEPVNQDPQGYCVGRQPGDSFNCITIGGSFGTGVCDENLIPLACRSLPESHPQPVPVESAPDCVANTSNHACLVSGTSGHRDCNEFGRFTACVEDPTQPENPQTPEPEEEEEEEEEEASSPPAFIFEAIVDSVTYSEIAISAPTAISEICASAEVWDPRFPGEDIFVPGVVCIVEVDISGGLELQMEFRDASGKTSWAAGYTNGPGDCRVKTPFYIYDAEGNPVADFDDSSESSFPQKMITRAPDGKPDTCHVFLGEEEVESPPAPILSPAQCEMDCATRGLECGHAESVANLFCSQFCEAYMLTEEEAACLLDLECSALPELLDETLREEHVAECEAEDATLPPEEETPPVVGDPVLTLDECLDQCLARMGECSNLISELDGELYCAIACVVFDPRQSEMACVTEMSCQELYDTAAVQCYDEYTEPEPQPESSIQTLIFEVLVGAANAQGMLSRYSPTNKEATCASAEVEDPAQNNVLVPGVFCVMDVDRSKVMRGNLRTTSANGEQYVAGYTSGPGDCQKKMRMYAYDEDGNRVADYDDLVETDFPQEMWVDESPDDPNTCHFFLPAAL